MTARGRGSGCKGMHSTEHRRHQESLSEYPSSTKRSPSWRELVETRGPTDQWGEAHSDNDLGQIPVDVNIRVVVLNDQYGQALRWLVDGSTTAADVLGGYFHDHLERGDGGGTARSGYLIRRSDGTVE